MKVGYVFNLGAVANMKRRLTVLDQEGEALVPSWLIPE